MGAYFLISYCSTMWSLKICLMQLTTYSVSDSVNLYAH
jgi:hypothetical protein